MQLTVMPMRGVRRAVLPMAIVWLAFQVGLVASAPVSLLLHPLTGQTHDAECTCIHGQHAICPMHHRSMPATGGCVMQGAAPISGVPGSLQHAGIVVSPASLLIQPETPPADRSIDRLWVSLRPVPPDPPPPLA
jgi:hypothetical protein